MQKRFYLLFGFLAFLLLAGAGCIQVGGTTAGNTAMGVYMSADGGQTWVAKVAVPTAQGIKSLAGAKVYRIFTDPGDPNAMYMGTRGQGLFYTYNNGESWQAAGGMDGKFIYSVSVDPKDKCTVYVSDGTHIYKTTDCLRTWTTSFTEVRPDQRFVAIAVDYGNSNTIYGAEIGGDVLRSTDGGASWSTINRFNHELRYLIADPNAPGRIYLASALKGLQRSDDSGNTWTDLSKGFANYTDGISYNRMFLNPAQKNSLFWVSKYGILRSDDAGATWTDLKLLTPPGSVNIYSFGVDPANQQVLYYTGTILGDNNVNVRSTLYVSSDGGKNWVTKKLPTDTVPVDILVNRNSPNAIYLGFTTL